jgi:hypothetical protein
LLLCCCCCCRLSHNRQGLADLTQGTLLQNASFQGIGNGSIAQSIMRSAVPMTLAQDGEAICVCCKWTCVWYE